MSTVVGGCSSDGRADLSAWERLNDAQAALEELRLANWRRLRTILLLCGPELGIDVIRTSSSFIRIVSGGRILQNLWREGGL